MESIIWNTLTLWFSKYPQLIPFTMVVVLIVWKGIPYLWKQQTGKFKEDYEAKVNTRASIGEMKADVIEIKDNLKLINGDIQKHHLDTDCHFKKSEYEVLRNQDKGELKDYFATIQDINLRALEILVKMNKQPRAVKKTLVKGE